MAERPVDRVERQAGVPGLVDILSERIPPTDLQSLLMEVYRRRAAQTCRALLLLATPRTGSPVLRHSIRPGWSHSSSGRLVVATRRLPGLGPVAGVSAGDQRRGCDGRPEQSGVHRSQHRGGVRFQQRSGS